MLRASSYRECLQGTADTGDGLGRKGLDADAIAGGRKLHANEDRANVRGAGKFSTSILTDFKTRDCTCLKDPPKRKDKSFRRII